MNWIMGPAKEKYIHYKKAGNQYVGRIICGLNVNSPEFGVSPPYCDLRTIYGIMEEDINNAMNNE